MSWHFLVIDVVALITCDLTRTRAAALFVAAALIGFGGRKPIRKRTFFIFGLKISDEDKGLPVVIQMTTS